MKVIRQIIVFKINRLIRVPGSSLIAQLPTPILRSSGFKLVGVLPMLAQSEGDLPIAGRCVAGFARSVARRSHIGAIRFAIARADHFSRGDAAGILLPGAFENGTSNKSSSWIDLVETALDSSPKCGEALSVSHELTINP